MNQQRRKERSERVRRLGLEAGFARVGIAASGPVARTAHLDAWLARGWAGEMAYLARHRALRGDPARLLPGARSVIVVADVYRQNSPAEPSAAQGDRGRVARYAWGRDYHRVIRARLCRMLQRLRAELDAPFEARICVDTAPVAERELAAAAGIGWIGKNTLVLNADLGSFFFLGEIITTLDLDADAPMTDHCGTCTRCLDACPTGALVGPRQMDARRCIAYLTIEHRSEIPPELRPLMGEWVFGCDICQEVCPYNRVSPAATETAYAARQDNTLAPQPALADLIALPDDECRVHLAGSAMKRATPAMLRRNARIAMRNLEARRQAADDDAGLSPRGSTTSLSGPPRKADT